LGHPGGMGTRGEGVGASSAARALGVPWVAGLASERMVKNSCCSHPSRWRAPVVGSANVAMAIPWAEGSGGGWAGPGGGGGGLPITTVDLGPGAFGCAPLTRTTVLWQFKANSWIGVDHSRPAV